MSSHIQLAQEFLDDSLLLLEQGRLRSSADRAYYAVHHAATALLIQRNVEPPKSHRGLVNLFGREIVKNNVMDSEFSRILSTALEHRSRSVYSTRPPIAPEDVEATVANAERFLDKAISILNQPRP